MKRHGLRCLSLTLTLGLGVGCSLLPGQAKPAEVPVLDAQPIQVGKTPHGMAAAGGFVYNSNTGGGSISVVDTATDTVVKTLDLAGGKPGYAKAFHDGKHVMIADSAKKTIMVLDPAADHATIQTFQAGEGIDKIVLSHDDKTALVSLTGESKICGSTSTPTAPRPPCARISRSGRSPVRGASIGRCHSRVAGPWHPTRARTTCR